VPTPPSGFANVTLVFDLPGQATDDATIVYGIQAAAYDTSLAELLFDAWETTILPNQHNGGLLLRAEIETGDGFTYTSTQTAVTGGASGDNEQPQVAVLIQKRTAQGGRANRGRMYVPMIDGGTFGAEGAMPSGDLLTWQSDIDDWYDSHGAADVGIFVFHANNDTPTEVTSMVVSGLVATQRRRGPRG
jgi:hypothetical protein